MGYTQGVALGWFDSHLWCSKPSCGLSEPGWVYSFDETPPGDAEDAKFYKDEMRLKMGATAPTPVPDGRTNLALDGFDLPRAGEGSTKVARRAALIPDHRNDENLVVAQVHLAMIRFHNRVVDQIASSTPSTDLFEKARELVVKHYQWMIKIDFLPRLVDPEIVSDVFANGWKFFEKDALPPTCRRCRSSSRWPPIGSATA